MNTSTPVAVLLLFTAVAVGIHGVATSEVTQVYGPIHRFNNYENCEPREVTDYQKALLIAHDRKLMDNTTGDWDKVASFSLYSVEYDLILTEITNSGTEQDLSLAHGSPHPIVVEFHKSNNQLTRAYLDVTNRKNLKILYRDRHGKGAPGQFLIDDYSSSTDESALGGLEVHRGRRAVFEIPLRHSP